MLDSKRSTEFCQPMTQPLTSYHRGQAIFILAQRRWPGQWLEAKVRKVYNHAATGGHQLIADARAPDGKGATVMTTSVDNVKPR